MIVRTLDRCDWSTTAEAMRAFTEARSQDTPDELWVTEHDPVYTQGVAGRPEHVHAAGAIPVRASNRGGQVTYHGPGQVVAYPLIDLRRQGIYVKQFVFRLESALLKVLEDYGVTGHRVAGAPGIYVRLDDPFSHGVALNVAMDLEPFSRIDPCGYPGLATVDLARLGVRTTWQEAADRLAGHLVNQFTP
jgi:lipoyl(octanoyl) transferase